MSSIVNNLFTNSNNLIKKNTVTDYAVAYKAHKNEATESFTPALNQGEKFKKYQKKIKKKIMNNINKKEGFENINLSDLNLIPNGLTESSDKIIRNNNYSSTQQQNLEKLKQQYQQTLTQYQTLFSQISGNATSYINRVDPANPYLGKNVSFTTGQICYVTNQGVVKLYPDNNILNSTAGLNGCPASSQVTKINLPWVTEYDVPGATIPTTPALISGTPMQSGQSCGSEGANIFVNEILNNPSTTYQGCYADNTTTPLMKFVGGAPQNNTVALQNGNFSQPQISSNSYQSISSTSTVPGWYFYAVLINNSTAWNYPMPYPTGSQAACIQSTQYLGQWINLTAGSYVLSFYSCGRPGYSGANTINIFCGQTGTPQSMPTVYSFKPSTTSWQQYNTTITISSSGNYFVGFYGTINSNNNSTAIQGIQLSVSGNTSNGSYTFDLCQQAAIDGGYQYFALQNVNPTTSQGYCAVSNDYPSSTSLGNSYVPNGQIKLWSSATYGQTGNTAALTVTGSLSVIGSGGNSVFSTPNSNAQPSNYLGCYGDGSNRAMSLYNGGSQQYSLQQCQQIAQQNGSTYFGLQNSTSGTNAQCVLNSNLAQSTKYGTAGNCTKLSDGSWSGGGWSNAVYNTNSPQSNYYLILQNDGNMCIYRGTGPSDNQGLIWASGTTGKLQQSNPAYAAAKGKYGQNWIVSGSTLAAGDFVGSTSGNMALIMQGDGNLVLYTFKNILNSQIMADGNIGGGLGGNALYNIGNVGIVANMGKLAYVDQNAEVHLYPSSNIQYTNSYTTFAGMDTPGNDIPGEAYGNATIEQCQSTCNANTECAGFTFSTTNNTCYPKTSSMYPSGSRTLNPQVNLYMRNAVPRTLPTGVPSTTNTTDTITFQNYINGGNISSEYGIAQATSVQQEQLSQLQSQLNLLSNQINNVTNKFGSGTQMAETQMNSNVLGLDGYLSDLTNTNNKITGFNTSVDNILNDSDIVVLQKNYDYLFWSILATGLVLVSMNIVKK